MLDYKGIEALYIVQKLQSFETAAKTLHITQSAISQRIKNLEIFYGEPLLIRTLPYHLTPRGETLVAHFKRVCLLEEELEPMGSQHISIALNRDSLETWFLAWASKEEIFNNATLEIIADDQERTLDYLKKGIVSACVSTEKKPIIGGKVAFLGNMEYILVASPSFVKTHQKDLFKAPALKFDRNDTLHERYMEKHFGIQEVLKYHIIPSIKGFKTFALHGFGYGLIPKIDILEELKKKELIHLYPDKIWITPLYWHYWAIESPLYRKLNTKILTGFANTI